VLLIEHLKGTSDIMVQRTGAAGLTREGKVLLVQNDFYYDVFFLKEIGEFCLNGRIVFVNEILQS
jgi:hypothetical protein